LEHIAPLLGLLGVSTSPVNPDAVLGKPAELLVQKGQGPCTGTSGIYYIAGQYHEIDRLGHCAIEHSLRGQIGGIDQYLSEVIGGLGQPADGPFQVKIAGMYKADCGVLHWLPPCTAAPWRKLGPPECRRGDGRQPRLLARHSPGFAGLAVLSPRSITVRPAFDST
jgi:hypothetical protein